MYNKHKDRRDTCVAHIYLNCLCIACICSTSLYSYILLLHLKYSSVGPLYLAQKVVFFQGPTFFNKKMLNREGNSRKITFKTIRQVEKKRKNKFKTKGIT